MKQLWSGLAVLAAMLLVTACSSEAEAPAAPPAPQVTVATPLSRQVIDWNEFVGRFEAVQSVEVRPRVSGVLQGVHFTDGQYVRRGQLLFTVDARPFQALLDQARAQLGSAQATLANARTELARSQTLLAAQAASQEEVEQRRAAVRVAEANVAAAQAAIRAQSLNVGFTRVTAPISGRISDRRIDAGNTVTADASVLTSIVSVDPIHFTFDASEALLLQYQRGGAGTRAGTPVRVRLGDETEYRHTGRLDFVDTAVNSGAGTIRARALIGNPGAFLRPGMFGHMQLVGSEPYTALLVPATAVVTDAARRVVYVVDAQGTVAAKPVVLGPMSDGLQVIRSGLNANDRVVINGVQRARPGQRVQATAAAIQPSAPAADAQARPQTYAPPAAVATPVGVQPGGPAPAAVSGPAAPAPAAPAAR